MALRIAVIGCGKITQRLALPQLARCRQAQVAALVDVNRGLAEAVARQFEIDRRLVWTDWRRAICRKRSMIAPAHGRNELSCGLPNHRRSGHL